MSKLVLVLVMTGLANMVVDLDAASSGLPNYRVLGVENPPYLIVNKTADQPYSGVTWDLLNLLSTTANFTYNFTLQADGEYGMPIGDGSTWNGAVGALLAGKTDLIVADLSVTYERLKVMDYTLPWLSYKLIVVVNTAGDQSKVQYLVRDDADETFLKDSPKAASVYANVKANIATAEVQNDDSAIKKVLAGGFAYVAEDSANIDKQIAASNGKLAKSSAVTENAYFAFGLPLGSPLRQPLNIALTMLQESGQVQDIIDKWHPE
jgi:hypothetical protein